jgi:hypothetical protein
MPEDFETFFHRYRKRLLSHFLRRFKRFDQFEVESGLNIGIWLAWKNFGGSKCKGHNVYFKARNEIFRRLQSCGYITKRTSKKSWGIMCDPLNSGNLSSGERANWIVDKKKRNGEFNPEEVVRRLFRISGSRTRRRHVALLLILMSGGNLRDISHSLGKNRNYTKCLLRDFRDRTLKREGDWRERFLDSEKDED